MRKGNKPKRLKSEPAEEILKHLPEDPPEGLTEHLWDVASDELGGWIIGFKRESIVVEPPIKKTMDWNDWEEHERNTHKRWAASCKCSCCEEIFFAGWPARAHKAKGIVAKVENEVYQCRYMTEGWCAEDENGAEFLIESEEVCCPFCGVQAELVHMGEFRKGRTYATQAGAVEVHGGYAMLVYYLASRYLTPECEWAEEIRPREALVIDRAGRLRRFSHTIYGETTETDRGEWKEQKIINPEEHPFYTWGAGTGQRRTRLGAIWFDEIPDLEGTTGEKTGLDDYIGRTNFEDPGVYWMIWRKHPYVENLVRAGWSEFVSNCIARETDAAMAYGHPSWMEDLPWVDLSKAKPHEQLRMSREEVRQAAKWGWRRDDLALWMETREKYPRISPQELELAIRNYTTGGLHHVLAMEDDGWPNFELPKVLRYLGKQKNLRREDACRMFVDYRTMLESAALGEQPTEDQLWPPHLREAHDGLSTQLQVEASQKYIAAFGKLKQKYRPLEWTDGELCVVVPGSNADLVQEGSVLHHCVGRYGEDHCAGKSIFFVRKYRRPERSYYTLNEDLRGEEPYQIQLHGYRNEYNEKGGGMHSIPQKVLDFVKRWEEEVLKPWFYQQPEVQERLERKKRKGKKAA